MINLDLSTWTGVGPTQFDAGPTDPTSLKTARFVYTGCDPGDAWCSLSCTLDGLPLPQQQCYSPVSLSVGDGVHTFTLTVGTLIGQRPTLSWTWSVLPLVIDAISAQAYGVSRSSISIPLQTAPAVRWQDMKSSVAVAAIACLRFSPPRFSLN